MGAGHQQSAKRKTFTLTQFKHHLAIQTPLHSALLDDEAILSQTLGATEHRLTGPVVGNLHVRQQFVQIGCSHHLRKWRKPSANIGG